MSTANRLDGIGEYYFSQKLKEIELLNKAGKSVLNLGIGSPDLPPHESVIKVLQEESSKPNVHAYQSYKGAAVLRTAIKNWYFQWYNVELDAETEILPLIGSKEGIMHVCMTYLNEGYEVLIPNPGYPTYTSAVKLAGGICINYELLEENNYEPNFNQLNTLNLSKVKLMFVNYPQMPTGASGNVKLFQSIVDFGKQHNILIIHDNPYSFILNDKPLSLLQIEGAKDIVIELNSLSKSHNMAGWRIGMMCAAKEKIDEVLRFKSNMDSGMYLPAQIAAAQALSLNEDWFNYLNNIYLNRRKVVFKLLDILNCTYATNQVGMFVWAKIPDTYLNGFSLSDEVLYQHNIFITPGGIFGDAGNPYIRISLCGSIEKFEDAINRIKNNNHV